VVQASAARIFSASVAMVAFLNCDQANSHSSAPPAAMALQYTVVRRLGSMLDDDMMKIRTTEMMYGQSKCAFNWNQPAQQ